MEGLPESELFALTALGSVTAQAELVQRILALPQDGICGWDEALCAAEIPARIAAAHGRANDQFVLASILMKRAYQTDTAGEAARSESYRLQAFELLKALVEAGSDEALSYIVLLQRDALAAEAACDMITAVTIH
jgi:hypothetical protein